MMRCPFESVIGCQLAVDGSRWSGVGGGRPSNESATHSRHSKKPVPSSVLGGGSIKLGEKSIWLLRRSACGQVTLAPANRLVVSGRQGDALGLKQGRVLGKREGKVCLVRALWVKAVFNRLGAEPGATQGHSKDPPVSPLRKGGKRPDAADFPPPSQGGKKDQTPPTFPPLRRGGTGGESRGACNASRL